MGRELADAGLVKHDGDLTLATVVVDALDEKAEQLALLVRWQCLPYCVEGGERFGGFGFIDRPGRLGGCWKR